VSKAQEQAVDAPARKAARNVPLIESRLPALFATLTVAFLITSLPAGVQCGPRWLLPVIVTGLLVPATITHRTGRHRTNHIVGQMITAVITVSLVVSLSLLIGALISHKEPAIDMLRSAAALWFTNVLVFALWYWRLDAGGPNRRNRRGVHSSGAFLFPQMTIGPEYTEEGADAVWTPQFMDYLFLSFNTSTALSPTDTPVLSRWAKGLCMLQACISLTIVVILAAHAVNIL